MWPLRVAVGSACAPVGASSRTATPPARISRRIAATLHLDPVLCQTGTDRRREAPGGAGALREEQRGLGELDLEQLRTIRAAGDVDANVGEVAEARGDRVGQRALVGGGGARAARLRGRNPP